MDSLQEYRTVILAAFLHDIGKLLGRGSFKILDKGQHPKFSSDFISAYHEIFSEVCDADLLKELVQKHHENERAFPEDFLVQSIADTHKRTLATLVSRADNLSSAERGETSDEYKDYKTTPLCSVVERLDREADLELKLRFHPRPLSSTTSATLRATLFPEPFTEYKAGEMNSLIKSFGDSFAKFARGSSGSLTFDVLASHLTNMLYTHTWCIPSNTQEEIPDVSLFDHLKTTAAIAACLYQYHTKTNSLNEKSLKSIEKPRFLIVSGDISGIQQYIFDITASTVGGVARMLRSRSLLVQLYSDVAAHKILHKLQLPVWNLLMSSGGNFFLLLPYLEESQKALEETQAEIDRWFMEKTNGELALNLAWHPFSDTGFRAATDKLPGFSHVISEVKTRLNQKKQTKFADVLVNKGWHEELFTIAVDFKDKEPCGSCHKYPAEATVRNEPFCFKCKLEYDLGKLLPNAKYVSLFNDDTSGVMPVLGYSLTIGDKPLNSGTPYLVIKLNDTDLQDIPGKPAMFKYIASHIPQEKGETLSFEDIASKAEGQHLLGFLKADVDRLGELFVFGLQRTFIDTVSRQATLSRLLDTFFTGWLESLVSSQFPDCYTVFSGGDDLFLVGPWDKIVALAEQIHDDFTEFAGNSRLTISAGIVVTKPSYPIARAADAVEKALEQAKDNGRNSITFLDKPHTWAEWTEARKGWKHFSTIINNSNTSLPSAFLYKLLTFSEMWQEYRKGNISGLRYHPLLAYTISRNLDARKTPELYAWAQRLLKWPPGEAEKKLLDNLGIIAKLCLMNKRGGKE